MIVKHWKVISIVVLLVFLIGAISIVSVGTGRGIPFVGKRDELSIGVYTGDSLFSLASPKIIKNPVLTAKDVTDISADFVADPFMVRENSTWYMFFEVYNKDTHQGDIGYAVSNDGYNWTYEQIVLDEPFHLSYPHVFKWKDEYYMIPESHRAGSLRLYRALRFPAEWSFTGNLLHGVYKDPSLFRYDNRWWLFAQTNPEAHDTLRLYYADALMGPWAEHPKSPIVCGDIRIAKPAGRVTTFGGQVVRYAQDWDPGYPFQVRAFEITRLTTTGYEEKEVKDPILKASGSGWNAQGMHHIDAHQVDGNEWIACVDGYRTTLAFGFKY